MEKLLIQYCDLFWAILAVILYFKVWFACNNIKRIADNLDKFNPDNSK